MIARTLMLLTAVGVMTACAPAAPDTSADRTKLAGDASVWFDHYNNGDADGVANLYAADAMIMPGGAPSVSGRPAIREYIAGDIAKTKAAGLVFKNGETTGVGISGDMAWVSGTHSVADASGATVDTGKYLSVYRRTSTGWEMVRDTWNSDKDPAAAAAAVPAAASEPAASIPATSGS